MVVYVVLGGWTSSDTNDSPAVLRGFLQSDVTPTGSSDDEPNAGGKSPSGCLLFVPGSVNNPRDMAGSRNASDERD